tara:strand:+ start:7056 stop:7589 length:534 start_codon:yes stop_codon:yes gene_type:complete
MWSSIYQQWKGWSLLNKLSSLAAVAGIAGALITVAAFVLDRFEPLFLVNQTAPSVRLVSIILEFENKYENAVAINGRGAAMFWYPGGGEYESGSFSLIDDAGSFLGDMALAAGEKRRVKAAIFPVDRVAALLRQGHTDLSLFIKGDGFTNTFSPSIAFWAKNISTGYLLVELAPSNK